MTRVLQYNAAGVPPDSPLRHAVLPYWHTRVNDEGVPRTNGFHSLVIGGKIEVVCPARAAGYGQDGHSIVLDDGRILSASAVILATGYASSWPAMFDGIKGNTFMMHLVLTRVSSPDYRGLRIGPSACQGFACVSVEVYDAF